MSETTNQIAHNDLAITVCRRALGWDGLCASSTSRSRVLLNTTDGCSGSGTSSGATLRVATATGVLALGGGDIVEGLVELSRHVG